MADVLRIEGGVLVECADKSAVGVAVPEGVTVHSEVMRSMAASRLKRWSSAERQCFRKNGEVRGRRSQHLRR
ncbi:MAG: hypothetical protein IJ717_12590 [Treponema sp.]|nr:hypothetical protein [Treponema sp.]